MKCFFSFMLFLLCQTILFSQKVDTVVALNAFDFNKYITPKIAFNSFETDFLFWNRFEKKANFSKLHLNLFYNHYQRNPNHQGNWFLKSNNLIDYTASSGAGFAFSEMSFSTFFLANTQQRSYIFKQPKLFVEADLQIEYTSYLSMNNTFSSIGNTSQQSKLKASSYEVMIPFFVGWGRVEDISSNWRSVRMLKAFKKYHLLERPITDDDIRDLADVFAIQRHKRYRDYRIGRMKRFSDIDEFLRKRNIISTPSMSYYNVLSDYWYFGINEARFSGYAFTFGIEPYVFKNIERDGLKERIYSYMLALRYEYHKALSEKWQLDLDVRMSAGRIETILPIEKYNLISPSAQFITSFYPNSRTTLSFYSDLKYFSEIKKNEYNFLVSGDYYISPKVRLNMSLGFSKSNSKRFKNLFGDYFSPYGYNRPPIFALDEVLGKKFSDEWKGSSYIQIVYYFL